jgi:hypothetical protein
MQSHAALTWPTSQLETLREGLALLVALKPLFTVLQGKQKDLVSKVLNSLGQGL